MTLLQQITLRNKGVFQKIRKLQHDDYERERGTGYFFIEILKDAEEDRGQG